VHAQRSLGNRSPLEARIDWRKLSDLRRPPSRGHSSLVIHRRAKRLSGFALPESVSKSPRNYLARQRNDTASSRYPEGGGNSRDIVNHPRNHDKQGQTAMTPVPPPPLRFFSCREICRRKLTQSYDWMEIEKMGGRMGQACSTRIWPTLPTPHRPPCPTVFRTSYNHALHQFEDP